MGSIIDVKVFCQECQERMTDSIFLPAVFRIIELDYTRCMHVGLNNAKDHRRPSGHPVHCLVGPHRAGKRQSFLPAVFTVRFRMSAPPCS
jgi:hypothetical protein